jgi:hypothetical protein
MMNVNRLSSQVAAVSQQLRFAQHVSPANQNALQQDLQKLGQQVVNPSPRTRTCLSGLFEAFSWGILLEFGEQFAHVIINVFKALFENAGDLVSGIFN